jgi:hypothetical protein
MIDPAQETAIAFDEAPKHIPSRPHISTLHRWRLRGVRGRRLETFLSGGRRFTTLEAIARFLHPDESECTGPAARDAEADQIQRAQVAGHELDKIGI